MSELTISLLNGLFIGFNMGVCLTILIVISVTQYRAKKKKREKERARTDLLSTAMKTYFDDIKQGKTTLYQWAEEDIQTANDKIRKNIAKNTIRH